MGQDGGQIAVPEPARGGGLPQRAVDHRSIVQRGQIDRLGQPQRHAVTESQKLRLCNSFRAWSTPQRALWLGREMRLGHPRGARVPGDFDRAEWLRDTGMQLAIIGIGGDPAPRSGPTRLREGRLHRNSRRLGLQVPLN